MTHESKSGEDSAFLTSTECRLDSSDLVGVTWSRSWTILAKDNSISMQRQRDYNGFSQSARLSTYILTVA